MICDPLPPPHPVDKGRLDLDPERAENEYGDERGLFFLLKLRNDAQKYFGLIPKKKAKAKAR